MQQKLKQVRNFFNNKHVIDYLYGNQVIYRCHIFIEGNNCTRIVISFKIANSNISTHIR